MIFALDLATTTGWCLAHNDGTVVESGIKSFKKARGECNGILFLKARKWMQDMLQRHVIPYNDAENIVVYEQAHFRGGAATELCVGLQTRAQEEAAALAAQGVLSVSIRTNELKTFATGVGNASKEQMCQAAAIILGREPHTDDEADAVLLAKCIACKLLSGQVDDYQALVPPSLFINSTVKKPRKVK
jgi:Holliday junction resolvasome RuvABC endonuclease subunit